MGTDDKEISIKKKKMKYTQKYRIQWEEEPVFNKWLTTSSKGPTFAYCKLCQRDLALGSGRTDLIKHAHARKHKKRAGYQYREKSIKTSDDFADDEEDKTIYLHKEPFIVVESTKDLFYQQESFPGWCILHINNCI